jgi:hypothetical protein
LSHLSQVDVAVLPQQKASGLGKLAQKIVFPAVLFAGLLLLSRNSCGAGGGIGDQNLIMGGTRFCYLVAEQILTDNRDLLENLTAELMEREVVSAEEFQMMLVEFKAKTIDYKILGVERNRESLPFQNMPASM